MSRPVSSWHAFRIGRSEIITGTGLGVMNSIVSRFFIKYILLTGYIVGQILPVLTLLAGSLWTNDASAQARIKDQLFWIGSHRLVHEMGSETEECHDKLNELEDAGHSVVAIGTDHHVCGLISVGDAIRSDAPEVVKLEAFRQLH